VRIGFVAGEYPPMQGGVGAYTHILARTLADQGHTVSVFSATGAQSVDSDIRLTRSLEKWTLACLPAVKRWAESERLDVVNIQYQTAAFGMSPWIHFLPDYLRAVPVVTTFHDLRFPYLFPKAGPLRDWIVRHLARVSDGAIVTNHEDFQRLSHLPRTALIPIGSNITQPLPPDFNAEHWRTKVGAQSGDFLLAYFGLVNRSKGLEILLESLAHLRADGLPARLIIVGGEAGTSDPTNVAFDAEIRALIQRLGLEAAICQTGFLSDDQAVAAYLTASDAVVLPFLDGASYRRGSLMAAIRYDCAIVSTTPRVSIPAFADGENMLLTVPGDSNALIDALRQLYQLPELRQRLRSGAAALAQNFEWPQIAGDMAAFIQSIIGAHA